MENQSIPIEMRCHTFIINSTSANLNCLRQKRETQRLDTVYICMNLQYCNTMNHADNALASKSSDKGFVGGNTAVVTTVSVYYMIRYALPILHK